MDDLAVGVSQYVSESCPLVAGCHPNQDFLTFSEDTNQMKCHWANKSPCWWTGLCKAVVDSCEWMEKSLKADIDLDGNGNPDAISASFVVDATSAIITGVGE